jgi:D-amino-acid dehydrogenase
VKQSSPARPSSRSTTTDVLVIGAGAVGAATARSFAAGGVSVTVVDRASGVGGGCSYANAGILAPDHVMPLATPALLLEAPVQMLRRPPAVRVGPARGLGSWLAHLTASATPARARLLTTRLQDLAHASTRLHVELAEQGLNPTLRKSGAIEVYLRPTKSGTATNALSPAELHDLEPGLANVVAGFHRTDEWTVESRSFVQSMLDDARRHGADVRFSTTVGAFVRDGDGRITSVQTDQGRVHADHVVLASGLDSAALAQQVGLTLPIRGGRGYVIDVAGGGDILRTPVRLKEHRVVVTPASRPDPRLRLDRVRPREQPTGPGPR